MRKSEFNKPRVAEGLGDLAQRAEMDHEVQMARGELYKIAKYAIKLHDMLKGVSEKEGLEGWVQSKITKSADYIGSVYHHLDYDSMVDSSISLDSMEESYKDVLADKLSKVTEKKNTNPVAEVRSPKEIAETSTQMKKLLALREQHKAAYIGYKQIEKRIEFLTNKHNRGEQ